MCVRRFAPLFPLKGCGLHPIVGLPYMAAGGAVLPICLPLEEGGTKPTCRELSRASRINYRVVLRSPVRFLGLQTIIGMYYTKIRNILQ